MNCRHSKPERNNSTGFTLVEILLALLVIMIGVVTMTGVLGSSLEAGTQASADLHVVSFADMVLNHCHAEEWENVTGGTLNLKDYAGHSTELSIGTTDRFTIEVIGKNGNTTEHVHLSYRLGIQENGPVRTVTLHIWPGFDVTGKPHTFYTEIYNWKNHG